MDSVKDSLEYKSKLFTYIFKDRDYINNSLVLYMFSLDGDHKVISLDLIQTNNKFLLKKSDLFIDYKNNNLFIDNNVHVDYIDYKNFKDFLKFYDKKSYWDNNNIFLLFNIFNLDVVNAQEI